MEGYFFCFRVTCNLLCTVSVKALSSLPLPWDLVASLVSALHWAHFVMLWSSFVACIKYPKYVQITLEPSQCIHTLGVLFKLNKLTVPWKSFFKKSLKWLTCEICMKDIFFAQQYFFLNSCFSLNYLHHSHGECKMIAKHPMWEFTACLVRCLYIMEQYFLNHISHNFYNISLWHCHFIPHWCIPYDCSTISGVCCNLQWSGSFSLGQTLMSFFQIHVKCRSAIMRQSPGK